MTYYPPLLFASQRGLWNQLSRAIKRNVDKIYFLKDI